MRGIIIKIATVVLAVLGGIAVTLKYATDLVGRSTVVEDLEALGGKAGIILSWLANQPAIIFYWMPATLMASALVLAFEREIRSLFHTTENKTGQAIGVGRKAQNFLNRLSFYQKNTITADHSSYLELWADWLPICTDLENLKLDTPNCGIESKDDINRIANYLVFVVPLLRNGNLETAREAATRLALND